MIEKTMSSASWGRSALARWAPIPVRLIVGYGFMEHGYAKMARGADSFAAILHALGVPAPHFMAWVSILTELLGGFAVLVGAFGPFGYEVDLLYLAWLAALVLGGSGPFALDSFRQKPGKREDVEDRTSETSHRREEGQIHASS